MKALTVQEAALAWAQGKKVEACPPVNNIWLEVTPVGAAVERPIGKCLPDVFTSDLAFRFRLAPEPPAKKYRPWAPEEVPVGALIRAVGSKWRGLILGVTAPGRIEHFAGRTDLCYACENHEHSIDNGKTWLPCGVEVEA